MRRFLLLLALAGSWTFCGNMRSSHAETAGQVNGWCQLIDNSKAAERGTVFVPGGNQDRSYCWGAFEVIEHMSTYIEGPPNQRVFGACVPADGDRLQMVHVFRRYMEQHPEKDQIEFTDIAVLALQEAFPCKANRRVGHHRWAVVTAQGKLG